MYARLGFRRIATACIVAVSDRPVVARRGSGGGSVVIAFSAILVDLAVTSRPPPAAFWRCAYAAAAPRAAGLVARHRASAPRAARRGARAPRLAAGVLFAIDIVVWHYAIRDVGAGLATVLGNLQVVVVPFVALAVLGERVPRGDPVRAAAGLPRRAAGVRRARGRRLRREPGARRAPRRRHRPRLRRVPARPAPGLDGPAAPGGRAVRHVARRDGLSPRVRARDRRRRPRAGVAERRLADPARAHARRSSAGC